jgi:hypothetical protein
LRSLCTLPAATFVVPARGGVIVAQANMTGGRMKPFIVAVLAAALAVYLNRFAEPRWYPLTPDMDRWLSISLGLFIFLAVFKILSPRRSSLD